MVQVQLLAKRYAQALFDLALETLAVEQIAGDVSLVRSVLDENRALRKVLDNPVLDASVKSRLVNAIFGEKKAISNLSLRFLQLIVRKRREAQLVEICRSFEVIYYDYKNIIKAEVITASPMDDQNRNELMEQIRAFTHKEVELKETVDETLVGGFVMRVEDYQYDASIASQMRRLRKTFGENLFVKKF
ncbi:MAG: ATP synthase F1 subunit delta [Bacteroidales bacterium]|nr:ATP synthase F1 subunit delta [Bacteroidales bacterium]